MRIATFNANGIRSAARKGFYEWMADAGPDIVCIQELKAQREQLTDPVFSPAGYHTYSSYASKRGYSGVAIHTRVEPEDAQCAIGWQDFDSEGRFVKVDFPKLSVISIYIPSGSSAQERQLVKEDMLERMKPVLLDYRKLGRDIVICGDFNIAHKPVDIRNWKGNRNNSGFLPQERAWMDWLVDSAGFVDAFRVVDTRPGRYSWWSNRGQAYANNVGWRLDYQMVTPSMRRLISSASIYTRRKFSDHAPVSVEYDYLIKQG